MKGSPLNAGFSLRAQGKLGDVNGINIAPRIDKRYRACCSSRAPQWRCTRKVGDMSNYSPHNMAAFASSARVDYLPPIRMTTVGYRRQRLAMAVDHAAAINPCLPASGADYMRHLVTVWFNAIGRARS